MMRLLDRWFGRKMTPDQVMRDLLRGSESASGAYVNADTAMRVAAVYACVRVISETVASLPLHVYRKLANGKERADTHPLYDLLHDAPNGWQTSFEFRETMQWNLCLCGNAYALISWLPGDRVGELIPLDPMRMKVSQARDGTLQYEYQKPSGGPVPFAHEDILHLRAFSSDGVLGRSVLDDARDTIGSAQSMQEYAGKLFKNDATPGVVLAHPGKLGPEAAKKLREQWDGAYSGPSNARRTAVLEEGMKVEKLSMTADDAQFLESRKFTRSEIAGIFRVPPHLIGDLDRATFSNIEHMGIEFATHCIRPWIVRWEQSIRRALFTAPRTYFAEFNLDALTRGDIKSRYDAYAVGRNWGWLSANDIRGLENMNPVEGGDGYIQPLNMGPAGAPQPAPTGAGNAG